MLALTTAIIMILMARRGFNGFAFGFIILGCMLLVRRVDDVLGLIGEPYMSVVSSLVVALFCYQTWSIWKDRRDHGEYLHWRAQHAEELKLLREWQARMKERAAREQDLELLRSEDNEHLSSWNYQGTLAEHTRNTGLKLKR